MNGAGTQQRAAQLAGHSRRTGTSPGIQLRIRQQGAKIASGCIMSTNLLRGPSILLGVALLTASLTAVADPVVVNLDDDSTSTTSPSECTTEKPTLIGTKRIDDHAYLEKQHVGCRSPLCPEDGQEIPQCGAGGDGERVSLVVDNTVVASETGAWVDVMTVRKDSATARLSDGTAVIAASVQENGGLGGAQNITAQNRIFAKLTSGKWTSSSEVLAVADARRFKGVLSWDLPPSQSRLFLACFQKTWAQLRADATDEWTNTKCGPYPISYKRFLDKNRWTLTVIQHFPLGGALPAAVMKPAVESLAPNLGPPERSVGTCTLDAATVKAVSLLGPDARRELETTIRAQGGVRIALFKVDGVQIAVEATKPDADTPSMAGVIWTEGRALPNSPAIPWQAAQICTAANYGSELSTSKSQDDENLVTLAHRCESARKPLLLWNDRAKAAQARADIPAMRDAAEHLRVLAPLWGEAARAFDHALETQQVPPLPRGQMMKFHCGLGR
jgi:hypothetical protein